MFKKSRLFVIFTLSLMLLGLMPAASVSAGGGMPGDFCATGPRDPNPAWSVDGSSINNPGCSSSTRYVMSLNGQNYAKAWDQWSDLEAMRNGQPATYYNEWVGSSSPSMPTPPNGWCATGQRDPNPAWSVDYSGTINNPGCGSSTRYIMSLNGQNHTDSWSNLESMRNGHPATYYNEWVGGSTPPPPGNPGTTAPPPPADFCKKPGFNPAAPNSGWSVGQGQAIWNVCKGKIGQWMFQPGGDGESIGHQDPLTFKQVVAWWNNHGKPAGTWWFDRWLVKKGACKSGSNVYIHLPTRVTPSAPCGAKSIYQMDIRGQTFQGTWKQLMYIRRCDFRKYEATIWVIEYKKSPKPPCGC